MADDAFDGAHNALNRMADAYTKGRGCRISYEELRSLNLTFLGEIWGRSEDPRKESKS